MGCPTTHNSPAGDRLPGGTACRSPPGTRLASAAPRGRRQSRGVAGEWRRGSLQSRSVVTKTCARRGRCCKRPSIGPEDPVVTALTGSATDSVTGSRSVAGSGYRSGRPLELAEIPARLVSVPHAASGAPLCDPSVRSRGGAAAACSAVECRACCSRRRRSGSGPAHPGPTGAAPGGGSRPSGPVGSPASRVAVVAGCGRQFGRVGTDGDGQAGHVGRSLRGLQSGRGSQAIPG
jgi:hypothetical protein